MHSEKIKLISISKKKSKYNNLINSNLNKISDFYNDGLSLQAIGRNLNIGADALEKLFRLNDIKPRDQGYYARTRFFIDEHYFDFIDTEEKAYILGLIYADGNNYKKQNRIAIKLLRGDKEILSRISNILYGQDNVEDVIVHKNDKVYKYANLRIYSKHISDIMEKHGVVPRKSLNLTFPKWLNKKLYKHFIRGYLDGDGCIFLNDNKKSKVYTSLIGTASFNNYILKYVSSNLGLKAYKRPVKNQDIDKFYTLTYEGVSRSIILLDWLYNGATIFLNRKKEKYLKLCKKYKVDNK